MKPVVFALMFSLLASLPAEAQRVPTPADEDPVASARVRVGAFGLDPYIGLQDVGVDTNVFNTATNPQSDFILTLRGGTPIWLRTGRGLLSLEGWGEYVSFAEFETERGFNSFASGRYEWRFTRFRPYGTASYLNVKERPGYEIDARARRYETDLHFGGDFRVASKSTFRVDLRHLDYTFAGDEVFNGRPLNQQLNRTLQAAEVSWRQRLTALTMWVTRTSRESERFEFEPIRNADSFRLSSGFELGRFALVRGSAFVGFRTFRPADGGLFPEFSGLTADVDVSYTAPTQTRLSLAVGRDVQYSYENITPYYIQTGWDVTATQRVTGRWDVQATGGRDRLAYQSLFGPEGRTDFVSRYGGGVGYTVGDELRVGFNIQSYYRSSDLPGRDYGGTRAGVSVTYGY